MPPPLHQIKETCLYVKDLEATKTFYEEILGLKVLHYKPDRHIFFRIGKDVLLFFNAAATATDEDMPQHFGGGQQHVAFECSAVEYSHWKSYLSSKGIAIEH